MKVNLFQQVPYRFLPEGFEDQGISSVVSTPYDELVEPERMFDSYRWFMDEVLAAMRAGFDGISVTEHGQTSYDMMPNPNLPAAVLANAIRTERPETALIVLGRSLGKTREPLRIAEEYAMLDCLSGGRLVAGLPVGLSYDAEPQQRDSDGRDTRALRGSGQAHVSLVDGGGAVHLERTFLAVLARQLVAAASAEAAPTGLGAGFRDRRAPCSGRSTRISRSSTWDGSDPRSRRAESSIDTGKPPTGAACPATRTGWRSSRTSSSPRPTSAPRWSTGGTSPTPSGRASEASRSQYMGLPGYVDPRGVETLLRDPGDLGLAPELKHASFGRLAEARSVIAGSPATVREQILEFAKEFRIGNLLVMLQMGGMPHELTMKNIHLFAEEVLPHLQSLWTDEDWEHRWWPTGLPQRVEA